MPATTARRSAASAVSNPGACPVADLGLSDRGRPAADQIVTALLDALRADGHDAHAVPLSQPLFVLAPCTACGSADRADYRPVDGCCPPPHTRVVPLPSADPGQQPTPAETAQMMGGTKYQDDHDGRYPYRVTVNGTGHLLEAPAVSLDALTGSVLDAPRLYLDGSSWWWTHALNVIALPDSE